MAHRVAPEAEAELDNIWYYVAKESGSIEIADRLIDSITERFYLLASHPHIGRQLPRPAHMIAFRLPATS
jgi:plasmid stabilization system protein ParE